MLKFLKITLLSGVLLFASACSNIVKKGKMRSADDMQREDRYATAIDSYCYCPAKHGTIGVNHFDFDKYEILPESRKLLVEISKCILERFKEDDNIRVLVTGHCDKRGTQEYNLALGAKRANATKNYIIEILKDMDNELNVDGRFLTNSKGKAELVDQGETEEAHAKNRRSVIEFISEGAPAA